MILHFGILLGFQLVGEILARSFSLPLPGPVIGMVLLAILLLTRPRVGPAIEKTASGLLSHLSLLFVPAGVGIVQYLDQMSTIGLPLAAALVGSTVLSIAAGALTFKFVNQARGYKDERQND
ncbi:CidA/LrgA family protein [Celeribacter ethanolicus]|uniref:CidA/LrgA family protein n=1 Tax=Celeribacter ethanolicus TaxID=1758178 RepID=A0A291GF55_9RHOB|nr:CidA/LrgA family protein [Celeribacter ethanolicus]ATG48682.1 CidA/LrgA family protein [Celeribacter ethanolicus]TNE67994.1 MAG: CidA/LrgA family protein [Paracoccaceae bacterium]